MRAPEFWTTGKGPWPQLLAPAGWVYGALGTLERSLVPPLRARIRVICVGNLTAGGTGKTPVAIAIARLLARTGETAAFIAHGYRSTASGPVKVDPFRHEAAWVGDEALLLAAVAPTWVAQNRRAAIAGPVATGIGTAILDDGHQDPSLVKNLSLVVVDGEVGFGNRRCIPAGPLREPVRTGLARADATIVMGADRAGVAGTVEALAPGLPVLFARLAPSAAAAGLEGRRVFAFAGIGRPAKFRATLEEIGADIQGFRAFPDHHPYGAEEVAVLIGEAMAADALPVTTAKDRVRLPPSARERVTAVEVEAVFEDEARLMALIDRTAAASGSREAQDPAASGTD